MTSITYTKRPGTSGIRGQLYETKLISLIKFRMNHNLNIGEFALATNMDNIGIFDDICLKFEVKTLDKPLAVFIQSKHRENDTLLKNDWATYFKSYLKIKQAFKPSNTDLIFKGQYDDVECFFVIYTTARGDNNNVAFESSLASPLNDVIGTTQCAQQTVVKNKDLEYLYKVILKNQVTKLAIPIAQLFFDEITDFQIFMDSEQVYSYHVILAQSFCEVSEVRSGRYRLAHVREEFFDTDDEILMTFKSSLYKEVIKKRRVEDSAFKTLVALFFDKPTDVTILSKVIGCVITIQNGMLEFVNNNMINDDLKRQLRKVHVPDVILEHAIEVAGRDILTSKQNLKVPAAFGNKDMTTSKDKRLTYLAEKIFVLIEQSNHNNVITIDESVDKGFLRLNGGIASAVGNLLVFDANSKMLKFNENFQELGDVAKRLLIKLKQNKAINLNKYRIDVKIQTFPKLTFECGYHDKNVIKDFINRLLFYTNQADENGTGEILSKEIAKLQSNKVSWNSFQSHLIFLKYHDDIQNWWMLPNKALYLTEESKIYENAMKTVVSEPPMTVMNKMYEIKTKEADLTFNYNVMNSLEFNDRPGYFVISKNVLLTLYKVKQYLQRKDHVVLDMGYSMQLQESEYETLLTELDNTNKDKIIIIVFFKFIVRRRSSYGTSYRDSITYEKIVKIVNKIKSNLTIIIANTELVSKLQNNFLESLNIVYDDKTNLTDLSEDTQHSILQKKIRFQGQEIELKSIVDEISKSFLTGDVLSKIIHNEAILLGEAVYMSNYDEVINMYIGRRVCRDKKRDLPVMRIQVEHDTLIRLKHLQYKTCSTQIKAENTGTCKNTFNVQQHESLHVDTLHDIDDDFVVLTTKPGMGKSTLFTHLFLQTKKIDQTMWIVRINCVEHCTQFSSWKQNKTVIDIIECVNFTCRALFGEALYRISRYELQDLNNELYIDNCFGDELVVFELKMFLHFYNRKKLIFLFDGLDEIWPDYAGEVLTLLKILKNYPKYVKHKIWITSRPYNNIRTILEKDFDVSYDLESFSWMEQNMFLYMFWIKHEILLNNYDTQLENIYDFIDFMSQSPDVNLFWQKNEPSELNEKPHLSVYINFICYLKVELKSAPPRIMTALNTLYDKCLAYVTFMNDFTTIPINLYIIAHYFVSEIKGTRKTLQMWHLDINFYDKFIQNRLKSISLNQYNIVNAYMRYANGKIQGYQPAHALLEQFSYEDSHYFRTPDPKKPTDLELLFVYDAQESFEIHKKLAAYAIFHKNNMETICERREFIAILNFIIELNSEKRTTGLINNFVNCIPIFNHETIAEYLAVEFVCDQFKRDEVNPNFELILNVLYAKPSVKMMFESKLKVDSDLKSIVDRNKKPAKCESESHTKGSVP